MNECSRRNFLEYEDQKKASENGGLGAKLSDAPKKVSGSNESRIVLIKLASREWWSKHIDLLRVKKRPQDVILIGSCVISTKP